MARVILVRNGQDLVGSDALLHVDGRLSISNVTEFIHKENLRRVNFPHNIATEFYYVGERLERISINYELYKISKYDIAEQKQRVKIIKYLKEFYPHVLEEYDLGTQVEITESGDVWVDNIQIPTDIKLEYEVEYK